MTVTIEAGRSQKRRASKSKKEPFVMPATFRPGADWFLAGEAIFTVQVPTALQTSLSLNERYTFRVRKSEPTEKWPKPAWWVDLLTGPENSSDYSKLGKLDDFTGQVRHYPWSVVGADSNLLRFLNHVLARAWGNEHKAYEDHGVVLNHAGTCARCGHLLTVPESVACGFGPECVKMVGG